MDLRSDGSESIGIAVEWAGGRKLVKKLKINKRLQNQSIEFKTLDKKVGKKPYLIYLTGQFVIKQTGTKISSLDCSIWRSFCSFSYSRVYSDHIMRGK